MDDGSTLQGVEALALREIPEHGNSILSTRGAKRTIWGHGHCVDVSGVSAQVVDELQCVQVPHLDELVPSGRDDDLVLGVW